MSLQQSPGIVTSGLTFYYDMNNTQKSFKGAPTTNYVSDAASMSGWGNYSNTANGTPAQFMTEFGTIGYRMDNVGSWNGVYKGISLPSTGTYTFSAWIKWVGGSSNVTGGAVYVSGWGGGDSATATNRTLPGQWQRVSLTLNCTTTSMTFYLICWGGTNNADHSSWQVTMPQVEAGSYATPFVSGTRSTTQAIVDLTGNNTVTATSLTYASNNTFSFNGSSNYISLSGSDITFKSTGGHTAEHWFKLDAVVSGNLYNFIGASTIDYHSWYWCVYTSRLAIWDKIVGGWYYGSTTIQPNTWYQAVMVTNDAGTGIQFYLNGVAEGGSHASNSFSSAGSGLKIGYLGRGDSPNGRYMYGSMPVTKVYNRALLAAEVKQNFNALRTRYGL